MFGTIKEFMDFLELFVLLEGFELSLVVEFTEDVGDHDVELVIQELLLLRIDNL